MRRVGIRDVAERAGVSISTVSNALNHPDGVSPHLVERVRAAAQELSYVPLQAAQQLRAGRSGLLGMTVINIANPYFAALVSGAEAAATSAGFRVLVGNSDDDVEKERGRLELFERLHVEGALVSPFGDTRESIERLRARGIPVVLVDAVDDTGRLPSVSFDDVAGGDSRRSICSRTVAEESHSSVRVRRCGRSESASLAHVRRSTPTPTPGSR